MKITEYDVDPSRRAERDNAPYKCPNCGYVYSGDRLCPKCKSSGYVNEVGSADLR